jgi:hypothetical protein
MVIDVEAVASGIPASSRRMSAIESIATPVRPTSPERPRVVGVETELGRQVEGRGEARLAALQEQAEARVRLLGRREARVLAHRPRPGPVAVRADAAREREGARSAGLASVLAGAGRDRMPESVRRSSAPPASTLDMRVA